MEDESQAFVLIAEKEGSDDYMELPRETDDTVLLSTIQAQFPSAIGLKYKSSSGAWRGIRANDNILDPPYGGWGETIYLITESDALKRKATESDQPSKAVKKSSKLLEDLIVLGLPYSTTEEELKTYFTEACGELSFCQLKTDRNTDKSRGFGFVRFKTEEAAEIAIKGNHEIQGRKLVVRTSQRKGDTPTKLFVGRLPEGVTLEEVNDYFSEFGDIVDCFLPNPFRGFAFITYTDQDDAKRCLRMSHTLKGSRLNLSAAEPKAERSAKAASFQQGKDLQQNSNNYTNQPQNNNYTNQPFNSRNQPPMNQNRGNTQYGNQNTGKGDVVSDLKDMLMTLINRT